MYMYSYIYICIYMYLHRFIYVKICIHSWYNIYTLCCEMLLLTWTDLWNLGANLRNHRESIRNNTTHYHNESLNWTIRFLGPLCWWGTPSIRFPLETSRVVLQSFDSASTYTHKMGSALICFYLLVWCERCLLITESPKTPGHYRYLIWVLGYIPYTGLAVFSFAISRVPVYTAISYSYKFVFSTFQVEVVGN